MAKNVFIKGFVDELEEEAGLTLTQDKIFQIPEVKEIVNEGIRNLTNLSLKINNETQNYDEANQIFNKQKIEIVKPLTQRINKVLKKKGLI